MTLSAYIPSDTHMHSATCFVNFMLMVHICSDWGWSKKVFGIPEHYSTEEVCHDCPATKSAGPFVYTDFTEDAAWTLFERPLDEFVDSLEYFCPLTTVPNSIHSFPTADSVGVGQLVDPSLSLSLSTGPSFYLCVCLCICVSVCLSACLPDCASVCRPVCLSVCLSVCHPDCVVFGCLIE